MAVNKNFVVKNGLEVNTNLIVADTDAQNVGIGTTISRYLLHVNQGTGIGASSVYVTGISTVAQEFNVGLGGTVFTVLGNAEGTAGIGQSVGVGTAEPAYLLDVRSPVSTGQTALYVQGDMRVTGDINLDDLRLDQLQVSGISTFVGFSTFRDGITVLGLGATTTTLNVTGIATVGAGLSLGDNIQAHFGNSGDLRIYHTGSHSYIADASGTGDIVISSNKIRVVNAADNEDLATFSENGSVDLYYDNTKRFETTSSGADVTGTFNSTGITTLASGGGISTTGGDLYVGGDLYISEDVILDTNLEIIGIATIGTLDVSGTSSINTIDSTVQSSSKDTGALVIEGGVGIEKNLFVGGGAEVTGLTTITGVLDANDTTQSSSSTTGAAKFAGGVGVAKNLFVGGGAEVTGVTTITGTLDANGDLDVDGHTELDNVNVSGFSTFVGFATFSDYVFVQDGLNVAGVITATSFTGLGQIGVGSEGTFIGVGITMVDFKSSNALNTVDVDGTSGIATVTVQTGVSIGLAIALGG